MTGTQKCIAVGVGVLTVAGFKMTLPFFVPLRGIVFLIQGMTAFANLNHKEWLEMQTEKRGVIEADEIIPPSRKRRESVSNDVIDMSMEEERQLWRAEAEVLKLERKLAQRRSALNALKRSAQ